MTTTYSVNLNMKSKLILYFAVLVVQLNAQQYFQQEVDYEINVTLHDQDNTLSGNIIINYKNNSSDVLDKIAFHLWPNAYSTKHTAFAKQMVLHNNLKFYNASEEDMGDIHDLNFMVDGISSKLEYIKDNPDMAWLILPQVLTPGKKITITTPFTVKIPITFSRLGRSSNSYQISQWYPKPAVYDHKGWHHMPYLNMGEFYSEFGNFDVTISVPNKYVVAASGELQNEEEKNWLEERVKLTKKYISGENAFKLIKDPDKLKSLRFIAKNVHDFAWFADKNFLIQKSIAKLPSGKIIPCWTYFHDKKNWIQSADHVARAVEFLSEKVGEYPWPHASAVESALAAGGGMEYPMITVIDPSSSVEALDQVLVHEVGHNWFYGILATNEREHPFMDEGINTYYENLYLIKYYGYMAQYIPSRFKKMMGGYSQEELAYFLFARTYDDQHPNQHSANFTEINYGTDVYMKVGQFFSYAEKYIGTEKMDECMRTYFEQWKFKHPYPEDLEKIFNDHAGHNMDWLFKDLLNTDKKYDYSLCKLKKSGDVHKLTIKNKAEAKVPFTISLMNKNTELHKIWIDGFEGKKMLELPKGEYTKIIIDSSSASFDLYKNNNYYKASGLFRKTEPLKIRLFPPIDIKTKTDVGFTPIIGFNRYNGFMLGAVLGSYWLPVQKWNIQLMPFYGFRNNQLAGKLKFSYTKNYSSGFIHNWTLGMDAKKFAYAKLPDNAYAQYVQLNPYLSFRIRQAPASNIQTYLTFKSSVISSQPVHETIEKFKFLKDETEVIHQIIFESRNPYILAPKKMKALIQFQQYDLLNNTKASYVRTDIEYAQKFRYRKNRYMDFRVFGSFFPYNTQRKSSFISNRPDLHFTRGSVGLAYQPYLDQLNENLFFGRTETDGFWSKQIFIQQGGFKLNFGPSQKDNLGNSNSFITSCNLSSDLPIKKIGTFIRPYLDLGYFKGSDLIDAKDQFMMSGGINLRIYKEILNFYFPVYHSKNISDLYKSQSNHYFDQISFSLYVRIPSLLELSQYLQF